MIELLAGGGTGEEREKKLSFEFDFEIATLRKIRMHCMMVLKIY